MPNFPLDSLGYDVLLPAAADAAGRTGTVFVSAARAHRLSVFCEVNQGNAATVTFTPQQGTNAAGAGAKDLTANAVIYVNVDAGTAGTGWVRVADGKSYTTDVALKVKAVRFDINPDALDHANGFTFVGAKTGASHASNVTSAHALGGPLRNVTSLPPSGSV